MKHYLLDLINAFLAELYGFRRKGLINLYLLLLCLEVPHAFNQINKCRLQYPGNSWPLSMLVPLMMSVFSQDYA